MVEHVRQLLLPVGPMLFLYYWVAKASIGLHCVNVHLYGSAALVTSGLLSLWHFKLC